MKINKRNAEHYTWGDQCDGWRLVNQKDLSVIHERMPPNTSEVRHYHTKSRQFFFVLTGTATLEINGRLENIMPLEGVEVPPHVAHQMMNRSDEDVEFLVISQPTSKEDRIQI
ncbi:cupin domain-containing protein [Priestia endophytica]|jgi:mannose-6-phosphate isomerase-like protein (cupin superfamily)|uniref:cupin domain-containing protein n=1 Tax=Priestia endophytica TaxID=135735 RepID=UPI000F548223|nr:cupin domain-containing protein [Priestia endophytica]MED4074252.1 cupin domain-containing protein [Priestia endophytica]RPK06075.1 Mannose-6-phosphate isomerase [Priestia endophytica]